MEPGKTYHLYTHANGSENLFRTDENYRYFLQRYQHFIPLVADTLVYCLMPNHFHFLIRIKTEAELITTFSNLQGFLNLGGLDNNKRIENGFKNLGGLDEIEKRISQQFSNLFNSYTKAFNKMYGRRGSLFNPNFKRKEIASDSYLTTVIHYIHKNAVHHGFSKNFTDWPWSSYHELANDTSTWLDREFVINWFGGVEKFRALHQQPIAVKAELED